MCSKPSAVGYVWCSVNWTNMRWRFVWYWSSFSQLTTARTLLSLIRNRDHTSLSLDLLVLAINLFTKADPYQAAWSAVSEYHGHSPVPRFISVVNLGLRAACPSKLRYRCSYKFPLLQRTQIIQSGTKRPWSDTLVGWDTFPCRIWVSRSQSQHSDISVVPGFP